MIERYKKRVQKWGQRLIFISFGFNELEALTLRLVVEDHRKKTGRKDISLSLVGHDMIVSNPEMIRMEPIARQQLKQEQLNARGHQQPATEGTAGAQGS